MKKSLKILATALCAVIAAAPLALTACGEDETPPAGHTHAYTYTPNGDGTHNGVCANADGKCTEINIANETCADGDSDGECDKCHAAIGSSDEMTEAKWKAAFDAFVNADYFQISGVDYMEVKYDRQNRLALDLDTNRELGGYYMRVVETGNKWIHQHYVVNDGWIDKSHICSADTEQEALYELVRFLTLGQMLLNDYWRTEENGEGYALKNLYSAAVYDDCNDVYELNLWTDLGSISGPVMNVAVKIGIEDGKIVKYSYGFVEMPQQSATVTITYNVEPLTAPSDYPSKS